MPLNIKEFAEKLERADEQSMRTIEADLDDLILNKVNAKIAFSSKYATHSMRERLHADITLRFKSFRGEVAKPAKNNIIGKLKEFKRLQEDYQELAKIGRAQSSWWALALSTYSGYNYVIENGLLSWVNNEKELITPI